jgi:hypothetical protein
VPSAAMGPEIRTGDDRAPLALQRRIMAARVSRRAR